MVDLRSCQELEEILNTRNMWTPYDPKWQVTLLQEQFPSEEAAATALTTVRVGRWDSRAYIHFVDSKNANKPNAEWQFERNIILQHAQEGMIVQDVLKDGLIGGVEFVKYIELS